MPDEAEQSLENLEKLVRLALQQRLQFLEQWNRLNSLVMAMLLKGG